MSILTVVAYLTLQFPGTMAADEATRVCKSFGLEFKEVDTRAPYAWEKVPQTTLRCERKEAK